MENPGKLVRRAARARSLNRAAQAKESEAAGRERPQRLNSGHAGYAALMRSHDRVHTRHIGGQGPGNGA